jgi:hypothetical protein
MWLGITAPSERFLNEVLAVIHPSLHLAGEEALTKQRDATPENVPRKRWTSVYTGIDVISNRLTKAHRDHNSQYHWYDMLVSLGHGSSPRLSLNDVGLTLEYGPGTIVALCGMVLTHEVESWGPGERVCVAHFMRENVLRRFKCPMGGWVNTSDYVLGE